MGLPPVVDCSLASNERSTVPAPTVNIQGTSFSTVEAPGPWLPAHTTNGILLHGAVGGDGDHVAVVGRLDFLADREGDDVDVVMDGPRPWRGLLRRPSRHGSRQQVTWFLETYLPGTELTLPLRYKEFPGPTLPLLAPWDQGSGPPCSSLEAPRFLSSRAGVRDKVEARRISRAEEIHEPLVQGVGEEVPLSHSDLNRNAEWPWCITVWYILDAL
uniref:Uncharacterized protein n=1 Tax=Oryza rufipogon TaxID=4529 RepID=A0A0E0QHI7_ORYRU